ncbi:hypothetical protein SERLA73DRAFT_156074 [Serpula lacrymans var. lacrymans S7.3]|uniref:CCHC-type domain-containing protein n=1 Tax=Serpula lacrymans var. lacrymans (strain S7.3) TaxID=936435 RepID=F8QCT3_SERL3|nr:hypothetical protein SERLA73DRAFT_156074 [Serpula lacrymans var. lacrymans S7.3]
MSNLEYRDWPEPSNSTDNTPPPKEVSLEAFVKQELDEALEEVSVLEKRLKKTTAPPPEKVERSRTALEKPENFSGDKKKYRAFRESLLLHFEDDTIYFKDNRKKISFVLSFMKDGEAAAFRTDWLENRVDAQQLVLDITHTYGSWLYFADKMEERFKDSFEKKTAKNEILTLKQGNETAQAFFERFEEKKRWAGYTNRMNEEFLVSLLRRNMNKPLVDRVIYGGHIPRDYQEWKRELIRMDYIWREREKEKKGSEIGKRTNSEQKKEGEKKRDGTGYTYTGNGEKMEVDKAKFRTEGQCYRCGEKGHRSFKCKDAQKKEATVQCPRILREDDERGKRKTPRGFLKRPAVPHQPTVPKKDVSNQFLPLTVDTCNPELLSCCFSADDNKIINTQTKKEIRNKRDANTTAARAAHSDKTSAVLTVGKSLKSAALTADVRILTPDAANSTEENTAKTVEERSETPLKNLERKEVWTPEWVVDRLRDQKEERSIGILSTWTHKKRTEQRSKPGKR